MGQIANQMALELFWMQLSVDDILCCAGCNATANFSTIHISKQER